MDRFNVWYTSTVNSLVIATSSPVPVWVRWLPDEGGKVMLKQLIEYLKILVEIGCDIETLERSVSLSSQQQQHAASGVLTQTMRQHPPQQPLLRSASRKVIAQESSQCHFREISQASAAIDRSSHRAQDLLLARRIDGGEAIACYLPVAIDLLENEEFLVTLGRALSRCLHLHSAG
jgi:hypothetical protein